MATNEQKIWNLLMKGIGNPYGVAAVMGNLRAESSLNPLNMTGRNAKQWTNGSQYADAVNCGSYDQYSFAHDGIAFGLAQWLYWSRKQALHEFSKGKDIGSIEVQVAFLLQELPAYKTVWTGIRSATNVSEASDLVMLKYEKPGTVTEAAKQKRRDFAISYFDKYYEVAESTTTPPPISDSQPIKQKQVITTASNVLVRCGNGKEFTTLGKIADQGASYAWIASSENNWHAIKFHDRVGWVSGSFAKVDEG